jgi:glycosyltransferase involved in cell wall biosynthesis
MGPKISVVTVVYNGEAEIEQTVLSVLRQKYRNIEYVLIDGQSTDGTMMLLEKYRNQVSALISEKDKGIYDAMNKGVSYCSGDWIIFLNSGDRFLSDDALSFFDKPIDSRADILYGDALVQYHTFQKILPKEPIENIWKGMPFCHQATFVRAALLRKRPFDLRYRLSSDFNFFYQEYKSGSKFSSISSIICFFDYTKGASVENSLTSTRERKEIVLRDAFDLKKWLYYSLLIGYVRVSIIAKKMLGKKFSEWLIRFLKK